MLVGGVLTAYRSVQKGLVGHLGEDCTPVGLTRHRNEMLRAYTLLLALVAQLLRPTLAGAPPW